MTTIEKQNWIYRQEHRARAAISHIEASKRSAISELDKAIRQLRVFERQIAVKVEDEHQLPLFSAEEALSPELERLLRKPPVAEVVR